MSDIGTTPTLARTTPTLVQTTRTLVRTLAAVAACAASAAVLTPARADAIDDWHGRAVAASIQTGKQPPGAAFAEIAIVDLALYDAVNAIAGAPFEPYGPALEAEPWSSVDAAAAQAAHDVIVWLYPDLRGPLETALAETLGGIPDGAAHDAGVSVGAAAARGVIALRSGDGRGGPAAYDPEPGPGVWQPTPPQYLPAQTPWLPAMTPFVLRSAAQFRPGPPPALTSRAYARAWDEVRRRGAAASAERSDAETEAARFWAEHPAAQYHRFFARLAGRTAGAVEKARLYALLSAAGADALVAAFDAKYHYGLWRPVHAIPDADADRNRATDPEPGWQPLLTTPNHPEFPSAHSALTQALAVVIAEVLGPDTPCEVDSAVTHTMRVFPGPQDIERDVREARITGGLHYRFSMDHGRVLGARVGRHVLDHAFRPVPVPVEAGSGR